MESKKCVYGNFLVHRNLSDANFIAVNESTGSAFVYRFDSNYGRDFGACWGNFLFVNFDNNKVARINMITGLVDMDFFESEPGSPIGGLLANKSCLFVHCRNKGVFMIYPDTGKIKNIITIAPREETVTMHYVDNTVLILRYNTDTLVGYNCATGKLDWYVFQSRFYKFWFYRAAVCNETIYYIGPFREEIISKSILDGSSRESIQSPDKKPMQNLCGVDDYLFVMSSFSLHMWKEGHGSTDSSPRDQESSTVKRSRTTLWHCSSYNSPLPILNYFVDLTKHTVYLLVRDSGMVELNIIDDTLEFVRTYRYPEDFVFSTGFFGSTGLVYQENKGKLYSWDGIVVKEVGPLIRGLSTSSRN